MSTFNIVEIAARNKTARSPKVALKNCVLANGGSLYKQIEDLLLPPGIAGSGNFDAALACDIVKTYAIEQAESGDFDAAVIAKLSHVSIWKLLPPVLRACGFDVRRGKIMGLLADLSETDSEPTSDDQEIA